MTVTVPNIPMIGLGTAVQGAVGAPRDADFDRKIDDFAQGGVVFLR
jgi:hypothetical protein